MTVSSSPNRIPSWIRYFSHLKYRNAHAHPKMQDCDRIYATEKLLDGWDAEILLLAKDAGPASDLFAVIDREGESGWRHAQRSLSDKNGWRTNERLAALANMIPGKKLYGSAGANLLRADGKWSGPLPEFYSDDLQVHLGGVLRWVVGQMPNIKAIGCLGQDSWYLVANTVGAAGLAKDWINYRDNGRSLHGSIEGKPLTITAHYHPGARVSFESLQRGWDVLACLPNNSFKPKPLRGSA